MVLQKDFLNRGRKLNHLTRNLQKLFLRSGLNFKGFPEVNDEKYIEKMGNFKYSSVLEDLEKKLRSNSNEVETSRFSGDFNMKKEKLFNQYLTLVRELGPFCPFTSEKVIKDLSNQ